ncbi:MAG: anaerobic ribonucleoside-triphosphate reductase activating protein [Deltaproteobacteria bacterium]|jgi:pyruvate formate lyase activating enzyme|nr:anaerobic ribonucleoside-triphosphate reductase activating protein [Deltaproteobacteria bacterium]
MKISGLQPVTASDFPGRLAAIVFTQGCNFRCPFCHNGSLLAMDSESLIDLDAIFTFLHKRKKLLDGLVISGGEPCLQPDLARFCYHVKEMGYEVKLDTNGSRPKVVRALLAEKLVDFIAMDIKAPLHRLEDLTGTSLYEPQIRESISLIAKSGVEHMFRTTDVTPLLSSQDHENIKDLVPQGSCHVVQPFVPENALAPSLRTM